jgi:hypothetical protein
MRETTRKKESLPEQFGRREPEVLRAPTTTKEYIWKKQATRRDGKTREKERNHKETIRPAAADQAYGRRENIKRPWKKQQLLPETQIWRADTAEEMGQSCEILRQEAQPGSPSWKKAVSMGVGMAQLQTLEKHTGG